jgi:hypothetical protein
MSLFYDRLKKVQQGGHTKVKRIVVTNVKEYFPPHLKFLFTLLKEKKDGHRVTLREGDMAFQDFLALGKRSPKPNVTVTGMTLLCCNTLVVRRGFLREPSACTAIWQPIW